MGETPGPQVVNPQSGYPRQFRGVPFPDGLHRPQGQPESPFPSLITHRPTDDDDVTLASFGLPPIKVEDLTGSDASLLASVYRVANKAVAHLTFNSRHPQIDLHQYYAACTLLHTLLRKRLLSRY